jgi:glycosyltransferase involved in cell wall biosynthesis
MTRLVLLTEIIAPYRIPVFNALARRVGIDLHVIFLAETDETLRQWRVYKDEIKFTYQVLPSRRWRFGKTKVLLNRGMRKALKELRPDVVLGGGYSYAAGWQALWWANRHRVPFVLWSESNRHDARQGRALVEWLKRFFLRHCSGFVVPGRASFEYLTLLGVAPELISMAPNAVDNVFFAKHSELARSEDAARRGELNLPKRYILFVGRLVEEKGIFDLLEAYARLDDGLRTEVGLVFVGDGVSMNELMRRAAQIRPGNVSFPGFLQREGLATLYGLADALILPTHSDPWGLVVNEAMACGLPIIVSDVAGCAPDLVENGWNGYVVPSHDRTQLLLALDSLLRDESLRQKMGARSTERIQEYSPEICAGGLAKAALVSAEGRQ